MKRLIHFLFVTPFKALWKLILFLLKIPYYLVRSLVRLFSNESAWLKRVDEMEGSAFESECAELLRKNGFFILEHTGQTGDFGVDLIVHYEGERIVVQCKRYEANIGVAAVQEIYTGCEFYQADHAMCMTNSHYTKAAIALAETTDVELLDREDLILLKRGRYERKEW